jgi:hydroxymethylpyrimidine pyrophosphatase-like HAD family hydrolase
VSSSITPPVVVGRNGCSTDDDPDLVNRAPVTGRTAESPAHALAQPRRGARLAARRRESVVGRAARPRTASSGRARHLQEPSAGGFARRESGTAIPATMKLSAFALDYDGTIAVDGGVDPQVRTAIAEARQEGIAVLLVTGRRLSDLRDAAGDLHCFDVVVAENGAVLEFPAGGRHVRLGPPPTASFLRELERRGIPFTAGECLVETDARWAASILDAVRALQQPLVLAFNRGRLMVLPPAIAKSTGLRQALHALRISIHNVIGIGDAENDHDLLDACEVGVSVAWGSPALCAIADEVIPGSGPPAVAERIRGFVAQARLASSQMGRRRFVLGKEEDGAEVSLAVRGRTILIAGEPGTGKSWLAGLVCEQSILQGYCVCIIDPEGDYRTLEALPGVITLGGDDPPPRAHELVRALRYPDVSVIVDLSKISHHDKREYLQTLLPLLVSMRRQTGLPHKILLDEAHLFLTGGNVAQLIDPDLAGYILVTYRVSSLPIALRESMDTVVMVTRETDPDEAATLLALCRPGAGVTTRLFHDLPMTEAALLPGPEESFGRVRRFRLAPRLTAHVRHRTKYLDMPVADAQAFVFSVDGRPRARTLKEFGGLLRGLPPEQLAGHLKRHDFSRWIHDVFRDRPLASCVREAEVRLDAREDPRDILDRIAQAIRARYEAPEPVPPPMGSAS